MTFRSETTVRECGHVALSDEFNPDGRCLACAAVARHERHEAARLFEPAPAPLPGQVEMPGDFDG